MTVDLLIGLRFLSKVISPVTSLKILVAAGGITDFCRVKGFSPLHCISQEHDRIMG
jgi:hypothetical protein